MVQKRQRRNRSRGRKISVNRRSRVSRKRRQRKIMLFGLFLFCFFILFGGFYLALRKSVSKNPENKICKNIYIGPVNVSGMTQKEAEKALKEQLASDKEVNVTMQVEENEALSTLEEMGLKYKEAEKTVKEAVSYGKKGSLWSRYWKIRKLSKEKLVKKLKMALDQEKASAVITEKAVPIANHAVNATITRDNSGFQIEKEKAGKTVDSKKSIAKLQKYLNQNWKHKDITIKMTVIDEKPSVKASDLETIQDELGTFSTNAGGGERWKNLKAGAEKLNGTIVMPGETVSVHDITAPYDEEHGYVAAGSYENGQVVDSYGGGICQVSTTLYNTVLYAELEVVKRYPHSMLVAYVDPSRDAAIAGDTKDFQFKNSYDTPVYIEGEIDSANQLCFTIYGKDTRDESRKVEFESETTATEEYGVVYQADSEAALGSMQYAGSPHTGKTARLWKIVYQDGKEVSRDVINNSVYNKSDQVIKVGTASKNAQASAIVKGAVRTQDKAKIRAAISEADTLLAAGSEQSSDSE